MAKTLEAFASGAQARDEKRLKRANPYQSGSAEHDDWATGWGWIDSINADVEQKVVQRAE